MEYLTFTLSSAKVIMQRKKNISSAAKETHYG